MSLTDAGWRPWEPGPRYLGHPADAVAWAANRLADYGMYLEAGYLAPPGSFTPVAYPGKGNMVRATFTQLGSVDIHFTL